VLRVARISGDCSATVRFEEARTADGRPYEDETVDLEALQPHPTRGQPTRGAAAVQDGARSGAARLAKQPRPSSSSAAAFSAAAAADSDDSDDEPPAKVAKQQRRQQAAAGHGVGSARGRGGGVSSPAAAAAAVATPPIAVEAARRSPRRKRGRGEAEDAAAAKGGEGGLATKPPKFTPGLRGAAGHAATAARGTPTARPTAPHGRAPGTSNGAVSFAPQLANACLERRAWLRAAPHA
jgi:hypothetical protein